MTARTVDGKTIGEVYFRRIEIAANDTALKVKRNGNYVEVPWKDIHSQVLGIYHSYRKMGIQPGDRVAILSNTRPEWFVTDLTNLCAGIVTVPIYQSSTVEDVAYLLEHSGAKLVFAEDESQAKKLETVFDLRKGALPVVSYASSMSTINGVPPLLFSDFANATQNKTIEDELRKLAAELTPEAMATIVYTSGTTGQPKGVVLTHSNLLNEMRAIVKDFGFMKEDCTLAFLPFAHILGRIESFLPLIAGSQIAFAENINSLPQNLGEVHPTILVSVPRIYEKIYAKIQGDVAGQPAYAQNIFKWAVMVGRQVARLRADLKPIPMTLGLKYQIADRVVFSKIRAKFGGKIRMTISGGAPLSPELCEFYHAAGIKVIEGYGLTETTGAIVANHPDDYSFGTVGKPMGNTELRIAADGEIQVRGGMVLKEYYKNPEATKEVTTEDGWFCTGDIGEVTARGFLKITDRKKELIKTSGGKYIAPQKIENLLKAIRFISQGMVYGDREKYVVALITLNEVEVEKWAKSEGISYTSVEELSTHDKVAALIEREIKEVNARLASYESIKKFRILPRDFTIEAGELTPSMKLKRKVCTERYRSYIQTMY